MARTAAERQRVLDLKRAFGLTEKQAGYAVATVELPGHSETDRLVVAGYTEGSARSATTRGSTRKSPKVQKAIEAELARVTRIKELAEEDYEKTQVDAPGHIEKKLWEHQHDATITPNQTRALELIGKMHAVFVERVDVSAGEHSPAAANLLGRLKMTSEVDKSQDALTGDFTPHE